MGMSSYFIEILNNDIVGSCDYLDDQYVFDETEEDDGVNYY